MYEADYPYKFNVLSPYQQSPTDYMPKFFLANQLSKLPRNYGTLHYS